MYKSAALSLLFSALGVVADDDKPAAKLEPEPSWVSEWTPIPTVQPDWADIYEKQKTAKSSSPTSEVQGLAFNRIVHIWLENQDYKVCCLHLLQWH